MDTSLFNWGKITGHGKKDYLFLVLNIIIKNNVVSKRINKLSLEIFSK